MTRIARRRAAARLFRLACAGATGLAVVLLASLLLHVLREGLPYLDLDFLTSYPSRNPARAGIRAALLGTIWTIALTTLFAVPLGVAAAVSLEEYARPGRLQALVEVNVANLAGVPSIVFGMLGLAVFVRGMGLGRSILAGALTLSLMVLPVVVVAAREAIRAVPASIRRAAFALGATRWQVVRHHVLPAALPGICTGVILALSRAIGEAAPLLVVGAVAFAAFDPRGPLDAFTVLPIQIFLWTARPQEAFRGLAAAGSIVLLAVLLAMNAAAVLLRARARRGVRW